MSTSLTEQSAAAIAAVANATAAPGAAMDLTQFNVWFGSAAVYVNELPVIGGVARLDATGTRLEVPAVFPMPGPVFGVNA